VLVRVALLPLAIMQARGARAQLALQPEIAALRRRFAKRPEQLQAALRDLYRERGVSPLPGCLPLILQLPVMWVVYRVVRASAFGGAFFGVPLGTALVAAPPPVLLALLGVLAVTAAVSALRSGRAASAVAAPSGQPVPLLTRVLPFAVVPVALWLPLAVVVYLAAGNLCTLAQQALPPFR
jgi:YidC/Oxa1 family membrane protein insertase